MTSAADPKAVGDVIRRRREAQGLSMKDLADLAEVGRNTVSEIERGMRTCTGATLAKLARALGTSGSQVIAESEGREDDPRFYADLKKLLHDTVDKLQVPGNVRSLHALAEHLLYMETRFNGELPPAWNPDTIEAQPDEDPAEVRAGS